MINSKDIEGTTGVKEFDTHDLLLSQYEKGEIRTTIISPQPETNLNRETVLA